MWCGKENDPEGFDYISCPNNCKDNIWADLAFWGLASQTVKYERRKIENIIFNF
jgi:hypothetical protein